MAEAYRSRQGLQCIRLKLVSKSTGRGTQHGVMLGLSYMDKCRQCYNKDGPCKTVGDPGRDRNKVVGEATAWSEHLGAQNPFEKGKRELLPTASKERRACEERGWSGDCQVSWWEGRRSCSRAGWWTHRNEHLGRSQAFSWAANICPAAGVLTAAEDHFQSKRLKKTA